MVTLRLLGTCVLASALAGCMFAREEETGICIGEQTLKQIKEGKTSETWLKAVIGEPSSETTDAGDPALRVLRYSTTQETEQSFFDAIMGIPGSRTVGTIYFLIRDGIVVKFWADGMEEWRIFGGGGGGSGEKKD